jgi:hypothetical protein
MKWPNNQTLMLAFLPLSLSSSGGTLSTRRLRQPRAFHMGSHAEQSEAWTGKKPRFAEKRSPWLPACLEYDIESRTLG